jgi:hypothetical protein
MTSWYLITFGMAQTHFITIRHCPPFRPLVTTTIDDDDDYDDASTCTHNSWYPIMYIMMIPNLTHIYIHVWICIYHYVSSTYLSHLYTYLFVSIFMYILANTWKKIPTGYPPLEYPQNEVTSVPSTRTSFANGPNQSNTHPHESHKKHPALNTYKAIPWSHPSDLSHFFESRSQTAARTQKPTNPPPFT